MVRTRGQVKDNSQEERIKSKEITKKRAELKKSHKKDKKRKKKAATDSSSSKSRDSLIDDKANYLVDGLDSDEICMQVQKSIEIIEKREEKKKRESSNDDEYE
jgi:hypothetical protein